MLLDVAIASSSARPAAAAGGAPRFADDPEAALAVYQRDGFHVEPELLRRDECAALRDAAAALGPDGSAPLAPLMNPHRIHPAFLGALCHPAIVVILERLVGHPVSGLQSQYFPCVPGTPGFSTHQDNHYVEAERDAFASAWLALDDVETANGALIAYPGSHAEALLPVREVAHARPHATQAFNALRQEVMVPEDYRPQTLEVPCGAVIFLHGHLLHASHGNRSTRQRRALLMTYLRRGAAFRRGASAQRTEIDVYTPGRPS